MGMSKKAASQQVAQYAADITNQGWGLGRYYQPDERDLNYPMSAQLPPPDPADEHHLTKYMSVEQPAFSGAYPTTVACAWRNWISSYPKGTHLGPTATNIHKWCKARDGLPPAVRATTIRAGAQALYDEGFVGNYHWADTTQPDDAVSEIRRWLIHQNTPVIVGANIYTGFCEPTRDGKRNAWWATTRGIVEGEAAFIIVGWSDLTYPVGAARIMWASPMWGRSGICFIERYALARLLSENGEACGVTDKRVGAKAASRKMRRNPDQDFGHIPLPIEKIVRAAPSQSHSTARSFPNGLGSIDKTHPNYSKWFAKYNITDDEAASDDASQASPSPSDDATPSSNEEHTNDNGAT